MMRSTIFRLALLGAAVSTPVWAQLSPATPDRNPPTAPVQGSTQPSRPAPVPNITSGANLPPAAAPWERAGSTVPNYNAEGGQQAGTPASAPQPGANSFTEAQARSRIEGAGFSDVSGLRLDDQGIWRGRAMRGGRQVEVALDYRGNVSVE